MVHPDPAPPRPAGKRVQFPINARVVVALERLATKFDERQPDGMTIEQLEGWKKGVQAALELVRMTADGADPLAVLENKRG